jgi:hypothetical protein
MTLAAGESRVVLMDINALHSESCLTTDRSDRVGDNGFSRRRGGGGGGVGGGSGGGSCGGAYGGARGGACDGTGHGARSDDIGGDGRGDQLGRKGRECCHGLLEEAGAKARRQLRVEGVLKALKNAVDGTS